MRDADGFSETGPTISLGPALSCLAARARSALDNRLTGRSMARRLWLTGRWRRRSDELHMDGTPPRGGGCSDRGGGTSKAVEPVETEAALPGVLGV